MAILCILTILTDSVNDESRINSGPIAMCVAVLSHVPVPSSCYVHCEQCINFVEICKALTWMYESEASSLAMC